MDYKIVKKSITLFLLILLAVNAAACGGIIFNSDNDPEEYYPMPESSAEWSVIDVSSWQEEIDWKKVAASGIKGTILRLARYDMEKDEYFDRNYNAAKEAGILVGCYYFTGAQSVADAEAEADHVVRLLEEGEYKLELPVFYDVEDEHDGSRRMSSLDRQTLTDIIAAFCESLNDAGYYAGYYSNASFAKTEYYSKKLGKYPFWVAEWSDSLDYNGNYAMWQYSCTAAVDGIFGECDISKCYVDFYSFILENKWNFLHEIETA